MKALIVGYGNPLREDDAAGFRAAERAGGMAVHQLTPELAADIGDADVVVFIDADRRLPAGAWVVEDVAVSGAGDMTHHCTPGALLAMARMLYGKVPEDVKLIRIGGERWGHGAELSPACAAAVGRIVEYLARLGDGPRQV